MKNKSVLLLCLAVLTLSAGCGRSGASAGKTSPRTAGVSDVLAAGMAEADAQNASPSPVIAPTAVPTATPLPSPVPTAPPDLSNSAEGIDIDLTALSGTMIYSQVFNMISAPEEYAGCIVRMAGRFTLYHDQASGVNYYACFIADAAACCAQGIEFEPTADYRYPEDFPALGDPICVTGEFDVYQEGAFTYCTLRSATFTLGS